MQGAANNGDQRQVAAQGLFAAAQDDGVAGLQAEDGDIDGGVGAGLVDDAEDADRNASSAKAQTVGQQAAFQFGANRVGQRRDLPRVVRQPMYSFRRQQQAVQQGVAETIGAAAAMSSSFCARTSGPSLPRHRRWHEAASFFCVTLTPPVCGSPAARPAPSPPDQPAAPPPGHCGANFPRGRLVP